MGDLLKKIQIDENKFNAIKKIVEENERGDVRVDMPVLKNSVFYSIKDRDTTLYIKKNIDGYILSRVEFENKRNGALTKVFEVLKIIAIEEKCKVIVVESVLSEDMYKFCLKNGFKKVKAQFDILGEDSIYGNYEYEL